jgi:hypothetical protein
MHLLKREYVKMNPVEKAVIVARVEAKLYKFIIGPSMGCLEGCRCEACFQKALDLLVTKTETITVNLQSNDSEILEWLS